MQLWKALNHSRKPLGGVLQTLEILWVALTEERQWRRTLETVQLINEVYFSSIFSADWIMLPLYVSTESNWQNSLCSICFLLFDIGVSLICHLKPWPGPFYSITAITMNWPFTKQNSSQKKKKPKNFIYLFILFRCRHGRKIVLKRILRKFSFSHKNVA